MNNFCLAFIDSINILGWISRKIVHGKAFPPLIFDRFTCGTINRYGPAKLRWLFIIYNFNPLGMVPRQGSLAL